MFTTAAVPRPPRLDAKILFLLAVLLASGVTFFAVCADAHADGQPLRVYGIEGALPVSTLTIGSFRTTSVQIGHEDAVVRLAGDVFLNGEHIVTQSELSDAAFVSGCQGALALLASAMLAHALRQALQAWRLQAWLARQPKADGDPYRSHVSTPAPDRPALPRRT